MTAETAVTLSPGLALLGFLGVVLLLLVLIAKWKWHVFLALLVPLLLFGFLPGIRTNNFIAAFETGFGSTLGSIGVVIVLGSVMSEALRQTGAIKTITRSMVRLVGASRMPLALSLSGFVLGIAIFSDVAYVILNPLVHSAAKIMSVPVAVTATGLVGALQLTHAMVPPTPGPLAAAAIVGADIGKTIIYGSLACLVGTIAGWVWGQFIAGPRIATPPSTDHADEGYFAETRGEIRPPGLLASYAPILVPVLLISAQSASRLVFEDGHVIRDGLAYIGWPVIALSIGVLLAYRNISSPEDRAAARGGWIEEGLKTSAMILVVTGLGGSLSEILKNTPAVEVIAEMFTHYQLPVILLPFLIGIIGNMITGSTTVGVITAASIVAPMLDSVELSPEAAMLAGAAGSIIIKYVNSSYFWVCTSLSGLKVNDAIFAYGGATLLNGLGAFGTIWLLWAVGLL